MDIREIQRLHAQFAPDTLTIDLTGQLAALPAPHDETRDRAQSVGERWAKTGPIARGGLIAFGVAILVATAGVGAGSIYTSYRSAHPSSSVAEVPRPNSSPGKAPAPISALAALNPGEREIDASVPQPVNAASSLKASDFSGGVSKGITAEQFRNSIEKPELSATNAAQPKVASEIERAMNSPIRRPPTPNARESKAGTTAPTAALIAAPGPANEAPNSPAARDMQSQAVVVSPVALQQVAAAPVPSQRPIDQAKVIELKGAGASAPEAVAAQAPAAKPPHISRRHIARAHPAHGDEASDVSVDQAKTQPAPRNRSGSNEVRMF